MKNILFIGAGNMASAIVGGIIKSNIVAPCDICLFDKFPEQYNKFHKDCIKSVDLKQDFLKADYVFLSVKPQNIKDVLSLLKEFDYQSKVFVSICAGVTIESISNILNGAKIIRTMPNTPLLLGQGVTALCKNSYVSFAEFDFVKSIFASSGYTTEIDEGDINTLTALTSSSPAYIYLFAKGLEDGAKKLGFDYADTLKMICYTLIGSANMILSTNKSVDELIAMVKSPNGTTERALNVLDDKCFTDIIYQAMDACQKRAEELSKLN